MKKPRVLLADDHRVVAEGLRSLLEPHFEVAGIVSDGRELLAAAKALDPDVVVLDISMPSLNGIEAARHLRAGKLGPCRYLWQASHRAVSGHSRGRGCAEHRERLRQGAEPQRPILPRDIAIGAKRRSRRDDRCREEVWRHNGRDLE